MTKLSLAPDGRSVDKIVAKLEKSMGEQAGTSAEILDNNGLASINFILSVLNRYDPETVCIWIRDSKVKHTEQDGSILKVDAIPFADYLENGLGYKFLADQVRDEYERSQE